MNSRLKQIIFNKLYEDLKHVEIIPYRDSIWFIDRKKPYWYLEYVKSGHLWWRWDFFPKFFILFSMEISEYKPLISEWVEEVLNCKIKTSLSGSYLISEAVEEVLNCKVKTSGSHFLYSPSRVVQVLNCKAKTTSCLNNPQIITVEEALNNNRL